MVKKILLVVLILLLLTGYLSFDFLKNKFYSQIENRNEQTNFLLLGINGSGGADKDLTDTIIFASLNENTKNATLISLPRDIWIAEIEAKINTAYHYGGTDLVKKIVGDILGQKIDYLLVIDFNGFEKIIDLLGGVSVDVKQSFDDKFYPIPGKEKDLCSGDKELKCRYELLHFDAGIQVMDGKTALKYVRSRSAEGEEGTDFARSERQQRLLQAVKQKLFDPKVFLNYKQMKSLYSAFKEQTLTEINESQYGNILLLASKIDWSKINSVVLNGDLLINPKTHSSRQWVLVPKAGNWQEVQNYVGKLL